MRQQRTRCVGCCQQPKQPAPLPSVRLPGNMRQLGNFGKSHEKQLEWAATYGALCSFPTLFFSGPEDPCRTGRQARPPLTAPPCSHRRLPALERQQQRRCCYCCPAGPCYRYFLGRQPCVVLSGARASGVWGAGEVWRRSNAMLECPWAWPAVGGPSAAAQACTASCGPAAPLVLPLLAHAVGSPVAPPRTAAPWCPPPPRLGHAQTRSWCGRWPSSGSCPSTTGPRQGANIPESRCKTAVSRRQPRLADGHWSQRPALG